MANIFLFYVAAEMLEYFVHSGLQISLNKMVKLGSKTTVDSSKKELTMQPATSLLSYPGHVVRNLPDIFMKNVIKPSQTKKLKRVVCVDTS